MEVPKLYLAPKKYTGESTVVSMRMPKDLIEEVDGIARRLGRTRSEFMAICLEFAMKHIEIVESEDKIREG